MPYLVCSRSSFCIRGLPKRSRVRAQEIPWVTLIKKPELRQSTVMFHESWLLMVNTLHRSSTGPTTKRTLKKPKPVKSTL